MRLITTLADYPSDRRRSVVAIGNFDGVHRGHATLLAEAVRRARDKGARAAMVTFEPHTRTVLTPESRQQVLSTIQEKQVLVRGFGLDYLVCLPFDEELRDLSAQAFIERILAGRMRASDLVMGPDHTFGRERGGNRDSLHELLGRNDIVPFTITPLGRDNQAYSSTGIRGLVAQGRMGEAAVALGHPYLIRAKRVSGRKIGTRIGFPTLNFESPGAAKVLPPAGIYAAELETEDGESRKGALYFGNCPTFENRDVHFEFHLFSAPDRTPAVGEHAYLWVHEFIRADRAFADEQALARQIAADIENISRFFAEEKGHANH